MQCKPLGFWHSRCHPDSALDAFVTWLMPEESLGPYTGDCKNQHSEALMMSSWKLASAKGWKRVPGWSTQGEEEPSFVNSVGHSAKASPVEFLLHFFLTWRSSAWLLCLYSWWLNNINKYPEHGRLGFDFSLSLRIFKFASPAFLKSVLVARPLV